MAGPRPLVVFINSDIVLSSECKAQGEVEITKILGVANAITAVYMWTMSVTYLLFSAIYNSNNNQSAISRHGHSLSVFWRVLHWSGNLAPPAAALTLLIGCVTVSVPTLTASTAFVSAAAIARLLVDVTRLIRYVRGLVTGSGSYDRLPYPIQETERW